MPENIPSEAIILVSVMPALRDFEIARLLGWYRIPLRTAPKIIDVDFLAFYQTGVFGVDHRWMIEYFAEFRGHELHRRKDLFKETPDHPRANEEYYKIQLGPLCILRNPIVAEGWKRITFFYSTGLLFNNARKISDLVLNHEDRRIVWRSLRERAVTGGNYKVDTLPELPNDSELLVLLGGLPKIYPD
jgi:hypothetical protein